MKMKGYKSKDQISFQIQRIFNNHAWHRLYNLAQSLAIKYNYNMSETERNKELHRGYMACKYPSGLTIHGKERQAEYYLWAMGAEMYPKSVYAK